jgi:hypothetical protein
MKLRHLSTGLLLGSMSLGAMGCQSGTADVAAVGGNGGQPSSSSGGGNQGGASTGTGTSNKTGGTSTGNQTGGASNPGSGTISTTRGGTDAGGTTTAPNQGGSSANFSSATLGGTTGTAVGGTVGAGGKTGSAVTTSGGSSKGGSETGGTSVRASGGTHVGTGGSSGTSITGVGGTSSAVTCSIAIKSKSLSTAVPTVGIVEWSSDLAGITQASIEFGLDTNYGMSAPVDLGEANYRTLILGMKAGGKTYHFRVVAKAGDKICTGQDNTLPATGEPPNALPQMTLTPTKASGLDGGFLVAETFKQAFGASGDGAAYIIDGDGDFVWWYVVKGYVDLARTRQSYDGKYMWITTVNVMSNTQKMIRVKMDGTDAQDFTNQFGNTNHDFAVRSDETIAFIAYGSNGCDDIKERSPDGVVTTVINSGTAVGASACHCNAIHYDRNDDTIVFSELDTSSIVKVARDTKKVVWLMSSQNASKATVTGINWKNEHGFHIIDPKHLLFFNNNTGPNSTAIEAELSISSGKGTATQLWSYPSTVTVQYMGDAQRLSNGNTLVTFSSAGEIREVGPSGTVLQTIKIGGSGNLVGFTEKRKSLYGAPPR